MITRGEILKIITNTNSTECELRVPVFEKVSDTYPTVIRGVFSVPPGIYNGYKVGDIVEISFEDHAVSKAVVLGKLYTTATKEGNCGGAITCNALNVQSSATLPINTLISSDTNVLTASNKYAEYKSLYNILDSVIDSKKKLSDLEAISVNQKGTPTETLNNIKIGNKLYSVSGGTGGDFNTLINRPKYNSIEMTGATNIESSSTSEANKLVLRDSSGDFSARWITASWLRTTDTSDLNAVPGMYPVLSNGWLYYRTLAETKEDLGTAAPTLPVVGEQIQSLSPLIVAPLSDAQKVKLEDVSIHTIKIDLTAIWANPSAQFPHPPYPEIPANLPLWQALGLDSPYAWIKRNAVKEIGTTANGVEIYEFVCRSNEVDLNLGGSTGGQMTKLGDLSIYYVNQASGVYSAYSKVILISVGKINFSALCKATNIKNGSAANALIQQQFNTFTTTNQCALDDGYTDDIDVAATGAASAVFGGISKASGDSALVCGKKNIAAGRASCALGKYTYAKGASSFATGDRAAALGTASSALGQGAVADGGTQTVVGRWNDRTNSANYAFIVGNGSSDTTRSNALTVDWNGYVNCTGLTTGTTSVKSSRIINNHVYFLEEKEIGTWTNGQPIYRKVFTWTGGLERNTDTNIGTIDAAVDKVVDMRHFETFNNSWYENYYYATGGSNTFVHLRVDRSSGNVYACSINDSWSGDITVIVEYTKQQ